MGKSRLTRFLLRRDVQRHYLGEEATRMLLLYTDCNRMAELSDWGLYELMLTTLVETVGQTEEGVELRDALHTLRKEAILEKSSLLAQRYVEHAAKLLCQRYHLRLCFFFDEFDELYRTLPSQTLANLRALRDENKYWLSYVLFVRDRLEILRQEERCEGFEELFTRNVLGLTPYTPVDARQVLAQLETRYGVELFSISPDAQEQVLRLSGGHPGLMVALMDGLKSGSPVGVSWTEWAVQQHKVQEELRKLWYGLREEERLALNHLAQGSPMGYQERESLLQKGLLTQPEDTKETRFFSPLLGSYANVETPIADAQLHIDLQAGQVWVNGKATDSLTQKEFELLTFLFDRKGDVCSIEEIIASLYPDEAGFEINTGNITSLVRRVREKIEPTSRPRFLLNVRGRGYQLLIQPQNGKT